MSDPEASRDPRSDIWTCDIGWKWLIYPLIFLCALAVAALGKYHIVQSSETPKVRFVAKVHWMLAETFVSLDAITGQSPISARSKYPLAMKALIRDGILESEKDRDARIEGEWKLAMEEASQEIEKQLRQFR